MHQPTALVLDDDAQHRELMTRLLKERGYQVEAYANPIAFLLRRENHCCPSKGHCVDLIVTGNKMSGMDGMEFLRRINKNGCRLPDHRKGVFSDAWDSSSLERAKQLGCRFFYKPLSVAVFDQWISE
ncbi:MAG: response regulator [Pelovirga sp.]